MARTSKGQFDRLVTLHLVTNGDPQYFDWEALLKLEGDERVTVANMEDA